MSFQDDLNAQKSAAIPHRDVDVLLNGVLYLFRFKKMSGLDWASESDKYPARPGVLLDMRYGYNLRALTEGVAPLCGVRVDGDEEVPLIVETVSRENPDAVDEWADLFAGIDGSTFQRISDAIWDLNEYGPSQAVEAAKKARPVSDGASA
jgi:hypothetical protein